MEVNFPDDVFKALEAGGAARFLLLVIEQSNAQTRKLFKLNLGALLSPIGIQLGTECGWVFRWIRIQNRPIYL